MHYYTLVIIVVILNVQIVVSSSTQCSPNCQWKCGDHHKVCPATCNSECKGDCPVRCSRPLQCPLEKCVLNCAVHSKCFKMMKNVCCPCTPSTVASALIQATSSMKVHQKGAHTVMSLLETMNEIRFRQANALEKPCCPCAKAGGSPIGQLGKSMGSTTVWEFFGPAMPPYGVTPVPPPMSKPAQPDAHLQPH